ncbi:MAG: DUF4012 domain-containing protein [Candidatus Dormiibacterota bacterium]
MGWHTLRWPLLAVAVLVAAGMVDVGARYVPAVQALQQGRNAAEEARTLLVGDLTHIDPHRIDQANALLVSAAADFGAKSSILGDGWIADISARLPWVGDQLQAARSLRTAGEDAAAAGASLVGLAAQLADPGTAQQTLLQRMARIATQSAPILASAQSRLNALSSDIRKIPAESLLGPLQSARQTLQRDGASLVTAALPAISILRALPAAIGPGHHSYLLLLANPGEERPGGGYIGAVGQLDFNDGALTANTFRDSTFSDPLVTHIPTPTPLNVHLFRGHPWELADAGWSLDFPTAAAAVERIYTAATGVHPDGVIEVDPVALAGVLDITGQITVPPYPQIITGSNVLLELNYITNKARPGDPGKVYLPPFGRAVLDRLLHAPLGQMPALAQSLAVSAQQKHITFFFANAQLEDLVTGAGAGGQVVSPLSDALEVADGNLSGTKGDLFVTRQLSFEASVGADGQVHDRLAITYQDPIQKNPANAHLMINSGGAYRDYVQVVVPETAQVDALTVSIDGSAPKQVAPEAVSFDFQREEIGYWLIVPYGGNATITLNYEGPFADISKAPEQYTLVWTKQTDALTWPIAVSITMPGAPTRHWTSDLSIDRSFSLLAPR